MGGGRKLCLWFLANCEVQLCSALAAMSLLGVVVVCPVMLDPAIDTLFSSFEEGRCQTILSQNLRGISNCSWTSCREGCTAEIFTCTHLIVVYVRASVLRTTVNMSYHIGWSLPPHDSLYTLGRDRNLSAIFETLFGGNGSDSYGVGTLFPNPQGCIYPSTEGCADFYDAHRNLSSPTFPCYISNSNDTIVVTTVDKMGALRNIFYCLIPLVIAFGVFTYLFYQVGLIGGKKKRGQEGRGVVDEEGVDEDMLSGSPKVGAGGRKSRDKIGSLNNGAPPGIKKKLRKKFLPRRENSSKKRRKGKLFTKKSGGKGTLLARTPGTSLGGGTPSVSIASDDGGGHNNSHRHSVQFL